MSEVQNQNELNHNFLFISFNSLAFMKDSASFDIWYILRYLVSLKYFSENLVS